VLTWPYPGRPLSMRARSNSSVSEATGAVRDRRGHDQPTAVVIL
jgi:hypothetical protein